MNAMWKNYKEMYDEGIREDRRLLRIVKYSRSKGPSCSVYDSVEESCKRRIKVHRRQVKHIMKEHS